MINIWCDGVCVPNPGEGAFGSYLLVDKKIHTAIYGYQKESTNNRMELTGALVSLKYCLDNFPEDELTIYSDSKYLIDTMNLNWRIKKNEDIWNQIKDFSNKMSITWNWIKGHSGIVWNERADLLAEYGLKQKKELVIKKFLFN